MNELYWCANCESVTELTKHGLCSTCGSDAVDLAVPVQAEAPPETLREMAKRAVAEHEVLVLERMVKL